MSEEALKSILKDFGLTETESEIYLFLSRHRASKGTEIAKQTGKDKAQVYHILKNLQAKGLVEATLEVPVRFTPVPFESVVESAIQAKKDEAAKIESTKQELLNYWKNTSRTSLDLPSEKFAVIQGRQKIYLKIAQMVAQTKSQLSTITTVNGLLRADQFNVFEAAYKNPLKSKIQFRFLTEVSDENLKGMKTILRKISRKGFNFRGKNPDLHQNYFPQMVIKDTDETLFFIAPNIPSPDEHNQMCLWTNCKDLVRAFSGVFENLWLNSTDIEEKIMEVELGKPFSENSLIIDFEERRRRYVTALASAEKEIIAVSSQQGLISLCKNEQLIEAAGRGVQIKLMGPITSGNIETVKELSKQYEVKHVQSGYLETLIIDGKYLFQSNSDIETVSRESMAFSDMIYSDNLGYVGKIKDMLNNIWVNSQAPSSTESLMNTERKLATPISITKDRVRGPIVMESSSRINEKEILNKIMNPAKFQSANEQGIVRTFGVNVQAIIHPPGYLSLPDILFHFNHIEHSTFGAEDSMLIHFWQMTPAGNAFVPSIFITDNAKSAGFWRQFFAGILVAGNVKVVTKEEFQIHVHGTFFFAGWVNPISVPAYTIPPSCVEVEGVGDIRSGMHTIITPSGYRMKSEHNYCDAFVNFLHPLSRYSGPGTDGIFGRDVIMEFTPP